MDRDRHSQVIPESIPQGFSSLLESLGWSSFHAWWKRWNDANGVNLGRNHWVVPVEDDWVAFVGLPLLTRVEAALRDSERVVLGVSALPGCGKSTLCQWVKCASKLMGWPVEHLSIDDYYWPSKQLEQSMQGNPWSVPRALPGSHDIDELLESIFNWHKGGQLVAPRFDKSLRNGRGDRVGTSISDPQVVLMEGWFLGATPNPSIETEIVHPLSNEELEWRSRAVDLLADYQKVWTLLDDLWHLRAVENDQSSRWKQEQLNTLEKQSGVGYVKTDLADFNRMVLSALPPSWLRNLPSASVVMDLTELRKVQEIHIRRSQLSASSSSATG